MKYNISKQLIILLAIFLLINLSTSDSNESINEKLVSDNNRIEYDNNVAIVTDTNFELVLKKSPFVFLEFYAPWCGHCKTLAPEFEKAAAYFQKKFLDARLNPTEENKSVYY